MNRQTMLQEMGLGPLWVRRERPDGADMAATTVVAVAVPELVAAAGPLSEAPPVEIASAARQEQGPTASMSLAEPEREIPVTENAQAPAASDAVQRRARIAAMDWSQLVDGIAACTACPLCHSRTQAVAGVGDIDADWLVVGEAPGAEEDRQGEPFVGRAGQLLDNMLAAVGLQRGQDVYITNVLKCRPPNNRDPLPEEIAACRPWLQRQIELVQPRVMLGVGRHAANTLLGNDERVGQLRGSVHDVGGIPLVVTYHPAYLLRSPAEKARAWQDLLLARAAVAATR